MSVESPEALSAPLIVVLPVVKVPKEAAVAKRFVDDATEEKSEVEVACWRLVLPPTVSDPLALSAPPTVRRLESVVEPVTASVPVVVAPVVVSPPLKASWVVVALPGNG